MQSISIHTVQTKPQWLTDLAEAFNEPVKLLTFLELNPADFEQAIVLRDEMLKLKELLLDF